MVILLSLEFHTASCDTFYIVPTPSSHCPGEFTGVPCLTLQQYASNPSQSQNITFLVEPGTYNLSTILTVSNGYNFTMSSTNATVVCTSSTAQFIFNTVENVHISGMTFQRCTSSNGAIRMSRVTSAHIENSFFVENGYRYHSSGGGIYVTTSTVSISDCRFQNNYADNGGAIYAESSQITINGSTFNYNRAYSYGGGIHSFESTFTVDSTTFSQNSVQFGFGGGIYSFQSNFTVDSTTFSQNSAQFYGGAICMSNNYGSLYIEHIRATNTMFSENRARDGGAIYIITYSTCTSGCLIHTYKYLIECQFINNYVTHNGGAVYGSNNVFVVERNNYVNNTANSFGGALYVVGENSSVSVSGSSFINNTAVYRRRGWSYLLKWTLCEYNTFVINIHQQLSLLLWCVGC